MAKPRDLKPIPEQAGATICFTGGQTEAFDAVIMAMGYKPRVVKFLAGAGVVDAIDTPTSCGREARRIAGEIGGKELLTA